MRLLYSPEHLKDAGVKWVIIGHSERRTLNGETDKNVGDKVEAALKSGLSIIACFGETLAERESEKTEEVVERQLDAIRAKVGSDEQWKHIVLAYEPVWAIGTGKVATTDQVNKMHTWIREYLTKHVPTVANDIRIIYGGSVSEKNCVELIKVKDVDGFLVGGASLKPAFTDIVNSATQKHN
jgi:triosephosphate isomerase